MFLPFIIIIIIIISYNYNYHDFCVFSPFSCYNCNYNYNYYCNFHDTQIRRDTNTHTRTHPPFLYSFGLAFPSHVHRSSTSVSPSQVVELQSNAACQAASVTPCVFAPNKTVCLQLGQRSSARSRGPKTSSRLSWRRRAPRFACVVRRNGPVVCVLFPLDMWVAT